LAQDPRAKVACETFAKTGMIMGGRNLVKSQCKLSRSY